jgi:hypothetical protein
MTTTFIHADRATPRDPPETRKPPLQTLLATQRQGQKGKETAVQGRSSTGTGPTRSGDRDGGGEA